MYCSPLINIVHRLRHWPGTTCAGSRSESGRLSARRVIPTTARCALARLARHLPNLASLREDRILAVLGLPGRELFNPTPHAVVREINEMPIEPPTYGQPEQVGARPRTPDTEPTGPTEESCPAECTSDRTLDSGVAAPRRGSAPLPEPRLSSPFRASDNGAADRGPQQSFIDALLSTAGVRRTFCASDGRYYVTISVDSPGRVLLRSNRTSSHRLLVRRHHELTGRGPSPAFRASVIEMLRARAETTDESELVFVRVASRPPGDGCVIDLGDGRRRAIEINASGWKLVDHSGVHFWRPSGLRALPEPRARRRDRRNPRIRQHRARRHAPLDRLADRRAAARRPVSDPGHQRRARDGQDHGRPGVPPADRPPRDLAALIPQDRARPDDRRPSQLAPGVRQPELACSLAIGCPVPVVHGRRIWQPAVVQQ